MPTDLDDLLRELSTLPAALRDAEMQHLVDTGVLRSVDLNEGPEDHRIPMSGSSNVEWIKYAPSERTLYVAFRRKFDRPEASERMYAYRNVSEALYDDLFSAGSPGGTVWDRLRRTGVEYEKL